MKNTILGKVRFNDIEAYKDEWATRFINPIGTTTKK